MRVLIANPYFPPYAPGGAEHSLVQMCERFTERGWLVRVITNCYDDTPRREIQNGYSIEWINSPIRLHPGQQIDASSYTLSNTYDTRLADALVKSAEEMGPDTILLANNAQSYLGTVRAAQKTSLPVIGIVRDTQVICEAGSCIDNKPALTARSCLGSLGMASCFLSFQRKRGVKGWRPIPGIMTKGFFLGRRREFLRKEGLLKLDKVITISDALKQLISNVPLLHTEKIKTIRNFHTNIQPSPGAEVDSFLTKNGLRRNHFFLFAGRKTFGKGADIAVEAAWKLEKLGFDISVLFLGREKLWTNPGKNIVDHESVSQALLLGILIASKALLIPGRWQEGLHRTMIDALYAGVPVICTEAGAPPVDGVIDGRTGYIVPCENSSALADAMIRVLDWDSVQQDACRTASAERFKKNFGIDNILLQWEQVLTGFKGRRGKK